MIDGNGRRTSKTSRGVTTKYYYDSLLVAKETDSRIPVRNQRYDLRLLFNFQMESKNYAMVLLAGQLAFLHQLSLMGFLY